MADISKINAVLIANIAEIDDVLAANIAKVNGLVFTTAPAFTGLLDTYTGAAAAYSVRRLASATTVLLRVRRDTAGGTGDDDEADVAYDTNNVLSLDSAISNASAGVTATTLGQFLNVGTVGGTTYTNPDSLTVTASCFVDEWKDQAGSNDATQATHGSQPQIHSGTVNTDLITENGKPTIKFIRASNTALDMGTLPDFASNYFGASVSTVTVDNQLCYIYNTNTDYSTHGVSAFHVNGKAAISSAVTGSSGGKIAATATTNSQILHVGQLVSGTLSLFVDGTEETASTSWAPGTGNFIGRRSDGQFDMEGNIQEVVLWNTDESSDRSGIEGNMNAHYQIGNFGTPTSGLLATYTGAAAAYSVRQLANTAALAMRIREDGTDTETDIGFDANGDLDTAAISSHCGANNGYVVTWYDQSGNQNDATQGTSGNQPQIYNGAAVITENGKPTIDFASSYLVTSSFDSTPSGFMMFFSVFKPDVTTYGILYSNNSGAPNRSFQSNVGRKGVITSITGSSPGSYDLIGSTDVYGSQNLVTHSIESGALKLYVNGTIDGTLATTINAASGVSTPVAIGAQPTGSAFANGNIQEIVHYTSTQSSTDQAGIETNINNYFSIY